MGLVFHILILFRILRFVFCIKLGTFVIPARGLLNGTLEQGSIAFFFEFLISVCYNETSFNHIANMP